MLQDLTTSQKLIGKTRTEIRQMLGVPTVFNGRMGPTVDSDSYIVGVFDPKSKSPSGNKVSPANGLFHGYALIISYNIDEIVTAIHFSPSGPICFVEPT